MEKKVELDLSNSFSFEVKDSNTLISHLECSICLFPFKNPMEHILCGNIFCLNCISSVSLCPLCRKISNSETLRKPSLLIQRMIDALPVVCQECHSTMSQSDFESHWLHEHVNICVGNRYGCTFQSNQIQKLEEHHLVCPYKELLPVLEKMSEEIDSLKEKGNDSLMLYEKWYFPVNQKYDYWRKRLEPNLNSKIVGKIVEGEIFTVVMRAGDWVLTQHHDVLGWSVISSGGTTYLLKYEKSI